MEKIIDISDKIQEKLEEYELELLQHDIMRSCGATSTRDSEILEEVSAMYERLLESESNGENHTISKGLIEVFLRMWNIKKIGE